MPLSHASSMRVNRGHATSCRRTSPSGCRPVLIGLLIATVLGSAACVPLAATGIALGAMAVIDRRTIGAQTEDQGIEIKAVRELRAALSDSSGVAITSYNRRVLLTGQALSGVDKQNAGAVIAGLPNVRGVYNELEITNKSNLTEAASDTTLTTKVKTALLRDKQVPGNSVKVKTESSVVYLLGLVTNIEAQRAAEVASQVAGVARVVTVFEILSEDDARRLSSDALSQPSEPGVRPAAQPMTPTQPVTPAQPVAPPQPVTPVQPGSQPVQPQPQSRVMPPVPQPVLKVPPQPAPASSSGFTTVPAQQPSQAPLVSPRQ